MQEIGRVLVGLGVLLVIVGVFLWKFGIPLGHLPGDIAIQKPNFSFYFPFTTCLILSVVVSLVIWLARR